LHIFIEVSFEIVCSLLLVSHCVGFWAIKCINMFKYLIFLRGMLATLSFQHSLKHSLSYWVKSMYVPPLQVSFIFKM